MISPEERLELVARLKAALDDPHNVAGGSTPNYPVVWYITPELYARTASLGGVTSAGGKESPSCFAA